MRTAQIQILVGVIFLLISLIVGYIVGKIEPDAKFSTQLIISMVFFISASVIEIIFHTHFYAKFKKEDYQIWSTKSIGEMTLNEIRLNYHKVVGDSLGENDLYLLHFEKEFKKLSNKISDVAEKKELFVNADYFLNADNLLRLFKNYEEKSWRYSWQVDDPSEKIFEYESWCQFFEKTTKLAELNEMKEIKALLVVKDIAFLEHPRIKKLLDFYKSNERLECKIITKERYKKICDYNSFSNVVDFGLYGNRLLFVEASYEPEISGYFSKDKHKIDDYSNLFTQIWNTESVTTENPSTQTAKLTFKELISFDTTYTENAANPS